MGNSWSLISGQFWKFNQQASGGLVVCCQLSTTQSKLKICVVVLDIHGRDFASGKNVSCPFVAVNLYVTLVIPGSLDITTYNTILYIPYYIGYCL